MPLDGSSNYYYPPGTPGIPDQTIESEKYNTFLDDLVNNDLNIPRPVHRGGTGADNATTALINLVGEKSTQLVTNFDSHVWLPGSFYCSNATGQGAPVDGHAFAGICYLNEALANPPTNNNLVVEARDQSDSVVVGRLWVREKKAGVWSAWTEQVGGAVEVVNLLDVRYVQTTGDTVTGGLSLSSTLGVTGAATLYSSLYVGTTLSVIGATSLSSTLGVTGAVTFSSSLLVSGALTVTGLATFNGGLQTPGNIYATGNVTCTDIYPHLINFDAAGINHWQPSGVFKVSYAGYQPGGGLWTDSSDARIKTVSGDYTHGLAEIKQLTPRRFTFNGNDVIVDPGTADQTAKNSKSLVSGHSRVAEEGKEFIGLIAQECETIMPEMVTQVAGTIDGQPVNDIRVLNASALTYALLNAVKELAARVEQLEAAG